MRRTFATLAVLVVGATSVGACGSSDHGGMSGNAMHRDPGDMHRSDGMHSSGSSTNRPVIPGAPEIRVRAGSLTFAPQRIELAAGKDVTIVLTSTDVEHDLVVRGVGHIVHANAGKTARGGLVIDETGTYKFWCSVPGHRAAGMTGVITVTA
jgi:uncharacterized cupredoxin-like copper-binding protein